MPLNPGGWVEAALLDEAIFDAGGLAGARLVDVLRSAAWHVGRNCLGWNNKQA
ncbi:hypothetical protein ACFVVC_00725 [Pseudarthrobacter sp. NPDC058196]|uniref:hypothetical protein n=1 Tax=Pseudarthrobacter sp. NPDC058196 TaxID=3346376 RepID=UPI0036DE796E